jgi:hypothetical protein
MHGLSHDKIEKLTILYRYFYKFSELYFVQMSNPPSWSSGQRVKTVGKHEGPMVKVQAGQEKANDSG